MGATAAEQVERARAHWSDREWGSARAAFTAADAAAPLEVDDLERLAVASLLLGADDASADAWARAHHECVRLGDDRRAARCAFWLAFGHIQRGDVAQAGGWLGRATTVLGSAPPDCAERGYLMVPEALRTYWGGDPATANGMFGAAARIGARCGDHDLVAFGTLGSGQTLVALGQTARGVAVLDEVMVLVTSGRVSPTVVGLVYCAVIETCQHLYDVGRAREWTAALSRWCDAQPDLVHYRGQCLVHRSEVLQLHGEWDGALAEVRLAVEWLSRPPPRPSLGAAWYRQAELHRLRGEAAEAAAAYRATSQWGHDVQPGLALLRLAQGDVDAARTSIVRALDDADAAGDRAALLPAAVEILLAADDPRAASGAADELAAVAEGVGAPYLVALADLARGRVLIAEGEPRPALRALRAAWRAGRDLGTPYECARARELLGVAYGMLGDHDSAEMELDAARWVFQELSARFDIARLDRLGPTGGVGAATAPVAGHGLTGRELEVLAQIATGRTNRAIAAELIISEKTVARHVANIFTKLGCSSRAAATAYAFRHGLA